MTEDNKSCFFCETYQNEVSFLLNQEQVSANGLRKINVTQLSNFYNPLTDICSFKNNLTSFCSISQKTRLKTFLHFASKIS